MKREINILEDGHLKIKVVHKYEIGWLCYPMFSFEHKWIKIKTKQYGILRHEDSHCFLCDKQFDNGESMGLMYVKGYNNVLVCESCIIEASKKAKKDIIER